MFDYSQTVFILAIKTIFYSGMLLFIYIFI